MFTVTREFYFCYGHRLLNYNGKCAHPHGHNGRVEITLAADQLDERGMVVDFTDLKATIGEWIEKNLDHQMVLQKDDPLVPMLTAMNEPIHLMDVNPTAENFARLIYEQTQRKGFPVVRVAFWETEKCRATYTEKPTEML